jgi:hypothetical protein
VDAVIGDLNLDGKVDLVDFFIFADNFSAQGPPDTLRVTVYDTVLVTVCDTVTVVDLPEWEVVFSDNFDRSDGGPGGDWSVQVFSTTGEAATIAVADDQFAVPGGEFYAKRYSTPVSGDTLRVSVVVTTMAAPYTTSLDLGDSTSTDFNAGFGVVARSIDLGNNWQFWEGYGAFASPEIDAISITRFDLEGQTVLASGSYAIGAQESHRISLTIEGDRVTMSVEAIDGSASSTITGVDPQPLTMGEIVSINGAQGVTDFVSFDDFVVERRE